MEIIPSSIANVRNPSFFIVNIVILFCINYSETFRQFPIAKSKPAQLSRHGVAGQLPRPIVAGPKQRFGFATIGDAHRIDIIQCKALHVML
jgi:hypothetical protein